VGQVLYAVALALFAAAVVLVLWRRVTGIGVLVLTSVLYPFIYAVSTFSFFVGHPRYLLFLTPAIGLLLGKLVTVLPPVPVPAMALVGAAAVSSVIALGPMNEGPVTLPPAPDVAQPTSFDDLTELLRETGVRHAFADYWISYRATFEARERTLVTPVYSVRHQGIDTEVRHSTNPAYVFLEASKTRARFEARVTSLGVGLRTTTRGDFAVVVPERRVLPEEVGHDTFIP
jgi:hypothetical protein